MDASCARNRRGLSARLFLPRRRAASRRDARPWRGDRRETGGQISLQARLPAGEPAGGRQHDQLVSAMDGTMTAAEPYVSRVGYVRWLVCALLFAIVALNYTDRQVLSVLKPTLQKTYGWSEAGYGDVAFWFQAAYGLGYVAFGRIVDRCGAKVGGSIAVTIWTIAHMAHALVTSTLGFTLVRIPMGVGESGLFPCTLAATAEWFPKRERALAIGIFNAGSNVGAIIAPFIVPIITIAWGWKMAFILTGLLTFAWLAVWLI